MLNTVISLMGQNYDADSLAYFAQLSPQPSYFFKYAVDKFIKQLKANGNWSELDRLWLHATQIQQHARVSIVNPSATKITEGNSPTWSAGQGYTGNASNMYLNTNYNPVTNGVKYTLNNASLGYYSTNDTAPSGSQVDMGSLLGTAIISLFTRTSSNTFTSFLHQTAATGTNGTNADTKGFFAARRTGSTATAVFKNGTSIGTGTPASNSIPNLDIFILCRNNSGAPNFFSGRRVALSFTGSGAINQTTFYAAVQTLATDLGFNV